MRSLCLTATRLNGRPHLAACVVLLLLAACEEPVGTRYVGVFRGSGSGFQEVIVFTGEKSLTFTHEVYIDGNRVLDETGKAKLKGNEIELTPFTRCIDSATGVPLPASEKFISYSVWFLGSPPFDMLKPFPEHEYFLRKQLNAGFREDIIRRKL